VRIQQKIIAPQSKYFFIKFIFYQEYKVRVKFNNKHWIVTKSLHDFAALSEELMRLYPGTKIPECSALWDDDTGKGTKEEKIMRKQRYLEAYLRVYFFS